MSYMFDKPSQQTSMHDLNCMPTVLPELSSANLPWQGFLTSLILPNKVVYSQWMTIDNGQYHHRDQQTRRFCWYSILLTYLSAITKYTITVDTSLV